tara:strand:- start:320 stop:1513 length:1194 start_codon:yes stop_codon:yes gene_type:complete
MFLTEVRRHNDEELHAWAISLLTDLKDAGTTFTAHYIGYGQWTFGDENEFKDNKIILKNLFSKTGTTIIFCFDFTIEDNRKDIIQAMEEKKDAKLIWIGAEKDPFDHPRINCVFWPADMLLQNKQYKNFDDVEKEPSEQRHWISTSLGIRPHRIYMASLLKGMDLDKHGDLRIKTVSRSGKKSPLVSEALAQGNGNAPDNTPTLPLYVKDNWKLSKEIENISEESSKGYQELIKRKWWGSSLFLFSHYMALGFDQNNNAANFDKNLRHLYKDKTLEVVNETSHGYEPVFITEKFINAVIGLNLVIMNGPAGTVKLLEDLGWNSCRHVVNHDYDDITDPILRCEKAIRLNSKLFSDPAYCNKSWQDNLNILHDNSKWARDHLYNQILKNCEQQFKEVA